MFNAISVLGATGSAGSTNILPKESDSNIEYIPISGTLSDSANKAITITVNDFTNGMDSVNMIFYVDGVFKEKAEKILDGHSVTFIFPDGSKNYQIHMSTYSTNSGSCSYVSNIDSKSSGVGCTGITDILPKVSNYPSTYAPITGTLSSSHYGKKIEIKVSDFTNGMDSVNMGLYVDGVFKYSEEKIIDGGSATFNFPHSGKSYEIRMSTYSTNSGSCYYSTLIN